MDKKTTLNTLPSSSLWQDKVTVCELEKTLHVNRWFYLENRPTDKFCKNWEKDAAFHGPKIARDYQYHHIVIIIVELSSSYDTCLYCSFNNILAEHDETVVCMRKNKYSKNNDIKFE